MALDHTSSSFLFFPNNTDLIFFFPPEVVKCCGIDFLSKHISDGGICHNISMQESKTQSQKPEMKQIIIK